jgi:hypothetical protein
VHTPITLEPSSPPKNENTERVARRKASIDRFGGGFFKKLLTKKSSQNMQEPPASKCTIGNFCPKFWPIYRHGKRYPNHTNQG